MRLAFRQLVAVFFGLLLVALFTGPAGAHAGDQSYLYLDFGNSLTARFQMPLEDVADGLGIDIGGSDDEKAAGIAANADALRVYAEESFTLGADGAEFEAEFVEIGLFEETTYVEVVFLIKTGDSIPEVLEVRLEPFFDEIDDRDALLLVSNDWERGVVDNDSEHLLRFTPDSREQTLTLGAASSWQNFTTSVGAGLDHIRTGPDHMLFIIALLLPSVLIWMPEWKPSPSFGAALWRVTKIMTVFTIAHSVTFTLAGAGVVPTPSARITESIIALSIVATALHNLRPVFRDREWLIAFVFGLFHGFGFASLVQSLDVSLKTQLVSLAGRNIGIELGQLIVVLLMFPALYLLRVTQSYLPFFRIASVLLGLAGLGWMLERLFDAPAATSEVLNRLMAFPRSLLLVAVLTAVAVFWHKRERDADRLLTVGVADQAQ